MLGLCFVLLYSCPVKKFLIIYFDKSHSTENASSQFLKNTSLQNVKIAYLRRETSAAAALVSARVISPANPFFQGLLFLSFASHRDRMATAISLLQLDRRRAFASDPPRYLQDLSLLI